MISRGRSPGRFFSQCDYCNNRNKLAEERNTKILQSKRYALNAFDDMKNCELSGSSGQLEAS